MFGLTLEETLTHQEKLDHLCQEHSPGDTEIFRGNEFYGIDRILKAYAALPMDYTLKGVIPHGIYLSDSSVWLEEIFSPLPAAFYFTDYTQKNYTEHLKKHHLRKQLHPLSSPFLYLIDLYKNEPKPERKGTLFFLSHSTHYITANANIESLITRLKALEQNHHPVTVCVYWRDYQLGHHKPFEAEGFRIVSAGHMYDPLFLPRLYHLLSMHQYAAGNDISSHVFYAVKAGCPYLHIEAGNVTYTADEQKHMALTFGSLEAQRIQQIKSHFQFPSHTITPEQLELVNYYVGAQHFQSPEALRQQFLDLEYDYELAHDTQRFFQVSAYQLSLQLDEVPSEVSGKERRFLYHFFAKFWQGNEDVLEIGPFLGGTTRAIALGMAANPKREPHTRLYTCDRFQGYYAPEQLTKFLQPSFEQGQLPDELKAIVEQSSSFLEVFQSFHQNQSYTEFLTPQSQVLPDFPEEVAQLEQRFEPPKRTFGAVFVDGCKSWYGTKYFLLKMAPHVHAGTFFLFQDYAWYTCFWIPLIIQVLDDYFEPIAHVGDTYAFRLAQPLPQDVIATRLPDALMASDKTWIDQAFATLFMQAHNRYDNRAMTAYTLQHGSALTYLGYQDEAKAKLAALLTQPWAQKSSPILENALQFPTYTPQKQPIPLFTRQEYEQLIITQGHFFSFAQALEEKQQELQQTLQTLEATRKQVANLETLRTQQEKNVQRKIGTLTEKLALKNETLVTKQDKIEVLHQKLTHLQHQNQKLSQQVQEVQEELRAAQAALAGMESSKFWKLRQLWVKVRRKITPNRS